VESEWSWNVHKTGSSGLGISKMSWLPGGLIWITNRKGVVPGTVYAINPNGPDMDNPWALGGFALIAGAGTFPYGYPVLPDVPV
jgi:hypothetical protein